MTSEVPYETAYDHSSAARDLLEHKALIKAFSDLEKAYHDQWLVTPAHDIETLVAIKSRQDGLSAFRDDLRAALTGARIAEFNSKTRLHKVNTK